MSEWMRREKWWCYIHGGGRDSWPLDEQSHKSKPQGKPRVQWSKSELGHESILLTGHNMGLWQLPMVIL